MAGAAYLSAKAAYRVGAGLCEIFTHEDNRIILQTLIPEAIVTTYNEGYTLDSLLPAIERADCVVMGCGLGITPTSRAILSDALRFLDSKDIPLVLDADALTILSNWYAQKQNSLPSTEGQSLILTPHAGEAARLLACRSEDIQKDRLSAAKRIVERYHAICVLKGAHTIVAAPNGRTYVCGAGNPFMAMGGMGDLLSGVIAARWAYVKDAFLAACSSVWLHSAASDAIVSADPPADPSIVNTAAKIGSLRVELERNG
jgi:NAD(P)H-hydrate epimerase